MFSLKGELPSNDAFFHKRVVAEKEGFLKERDISKNKSNLTGYFFERRVQSCHLNNLIRNAQDIFFEKKVTT